jgi:uncharacterized protein (DUF488 family)
MAADGAGIELFTIGVYGSTPDRFFETLESARIDTFCDLRARRGVRGREYSFANANRLQEELAARGIAYRHLLSLAPSEEIRQAQWAADEETHTPKRLRTKLAPAFAEAYQAKVLDSLDPAWFLEQMGPDARRIVLFCVEREPTACHRSLLANNLRDRLGVPVTHLLP